MRDDNNMFDCAQIGGDDDNEDMDVDDSYAESGSYVGYFKVKLNTHQIFHIIFTICADGSGRVLSVEFFR